MMNFSIKKQSIIVLASLLSVFSFSLSAQENQSQENSAIAAARTLDELLQIVRVNKTKQSKINQARVSEFKRKRDQQRSLLNSAKSELAKEEAREKRLKATFLANEKKLVTLNEEKTLKAGNLGEMVGVVRQVSGDMAARLRQSVISAQPQYSERDIVLKELSRSDVFPQIPEIRSLWLEMLSEMNEQGRVVRFSSEITNSQGRPETRDIVRVGPFNLLSDGEYLEYKVDEKKQSIRQLSRQPALYVGLVDSYLSTASGPSPLAVDPSRGAILSREVQRETWSERVSNYAGYVGAAIGIVLLLGLLIVVERILVLLSLKGKINRQAKSSVPGNNPLGRIMAVYLANKDNDVENLELKLDEAVLKETPLIERRVTIIKVFAAVAPLMGLLGTVIGMIETFQSITLYGTSDPQLMADGISGALITTVLGIVAAIPLILTHSFVAGMSKNIVHILEEQSTGLIAQHDEAAGGA